jgi:hypothetical protein
VEAKASFAQKGSYESQQRRQKTKPYAKQFNWVIKGVAARNRSVDEEEN